MMSQGSDNYGVQFGDSAQVSGGVIAGAGAHIEIGQQGNVEGLADLAELRAALASLVEQLRAAPAGVADPAALVEVAESAQQEIGKEKPNKHIMSGLVHALMTGVRNSAVLADAVVAIQHAVSVLL